MAYNMLDYKKNVEAMRWTMTEKQQIEEMATELSNSKERNGLNLWESEVDLLAIDIYNAGYRKVPDGAVVLTREEKRKLLHEMYEQGKFDAIAELQMDGNVVLTKEEYDALLLEQKRLREIVDRIPCGYELKDKTRKETVKEIANTLISILWEDEEGETITIKDVHSVIRSVAKSLYGVEVDE